MISAGIIRRLRNILCLGAHSDDIEIGCGGTILRMTRENPNLNVCWTVFSANSTRAAEANRGADLFLRNAKRKDVIIHNFHDGRFPFHGEPIKEEFERLKHHCKPDLIFTHFGDDRHQDHRTLASLAWNTWRDHLIFEYEVPKYDGDLGHPNVYVPLDRATCARKAKLIAQAFRSQSKRQWFSKDLFMALPRLRGTECNSPTHFAEAFHCRKLVI